MCRRLALFASVVVLVGLLSPLAVGQEDERYDFDGLPDDPNFASDPNNQPYDPTDWMTSVNWSDSGFDPDIAFGPLIPDFGTRVEIETSTFGVNAPVIGPGDVAEAFGVRIARFGGPGLLTMTGGTLDLRNTCSASPFTCNSRLRVGNADVIDDINRHPGIFDLSGGTVTTDTLWIGSGSHGEMNMSGGVVNTRGIFYLDWTFDPSTSTGPSALSSVLNMTAGTINVGTFTSSAFRLYRTSSLNLDGGEILINGSVELGTETSLNPLFLQTPAVTVSITDGLLQANSFLQIGGSVVLDGGILRAGSFNEAISAGTVEINAGGLLQFNNAQESVAAVEALITSGFFTTSEASPLVVEIVDVGGTNFTQVSIDSGIPGDFDMNGVVDGNDFLKWQRDDGSAAGLALWEANYGLPLSAVTSVPEPSSVVLAMLVSVSMIFRRRNFRGTKEETNQLS